MEATLMLTSPSNSCAIIRRRTRGVGLWNSSFSSSASQCDSNGVRIRFPSLSLPYRHGGCFVSAYSSSSFSSSPKPYTRLYVSGLSFRTTEESLQNAFQNFGQLVEVNLVMDRIANRPRGFAFLRYATEEESQKAIEGMHGKELKDILGGVPEIIEIVGKTEAEQILHIIEQDEDEKVKAVLESIFSQLTLFDKDTISNMISKIKRRLNLERKGYVMAIEDLSYVKLALGAGHNYLHRQLTVKEQVVLRLESQYPDDVGIIAAFFLNYVKLKCGEALYVEPNEPREYLHGECIECMATSDNVVRAGLTPKHRDVRTLLSMLKYKQGFPEILRGVSVNPYTTKYLPPCDEFEVDCCILPQFVSAVLPLVPGPLLFLFISGKGKFDTGSSEDDIVEGGEVLFVPSSMKVSITAESKELHLYRAGVNSRFFRDL